MPTEIKELDMGGSIVQWNSLIDKDVLDYLKGLNTNLGTDDDPQYDEFKSFMEEIESQEVELISGQMVLDNTVNSNEHIEIDSENEVVKSYDRDSYLSCIGNILKGVLGIRDKPMTYKEAQEQADENGFVWMGKTTAADLIKTGCYDVKKVKKEATTDSKKKK